MEKIKVFLKDWKIGEDIRHSIECAGKTRGIDIEVKTETDFTTKDLPQDFDVYLIHVSEMELEDFDKINGLREAQPYSRFYGLWGGGGSQYIKPDLEETFDKVYFKRQLFDDEFFVEIKRTYLRTK